MITPICCKTLFLKVEKKCSCPSCSDMGSRMPKKINIEFPELIESMIRRQHEPSSSQDITCKETEFGGGVQRDAGEERFTKATAEGEVEEEVQGA